jgi:hypothetical protein
MFVRQHQMVDVPIVQLGPRVSIGHHHVANGMDLIQAAPMAALQPLQRFPVIRGDHRRAAGPESRG